jgi:hypothetical protein
MHPSDGGLADKAEFRSGHIGKEFGSNALRCTSRTRGAATGSKRQMSKKTGDKGMTL